VKTFRWNAAKNQRLQRERGVSFEEIVIAIGEGRLLDVLEHRNPGRYPRQKVRCVNMPISSHTLRKVTGTF
jgi:uncharacterized DUF497 family protein